MNRPFAQYLLPCVLAVLFASFPAQAISATIRLGYLEHPGSILCLVAAEQGDFRKERLKVELVRFTDARKGLAALEAGTLDAGAFPAADTLRAIAGRKGLRIIAGGGHVLVNDPVAELGDAGQTTDHNQGIVLAVPRQGKSKALLTRITAGLIRAYRTLRQHPEAAARYGSSKDTIVSFNPNPDFYRLERIWRSLELQDAAMKPDFLSDHVYEEIYCDAIDRLLDSAPADPVYRELSAKAVCTPDCCPKSGKK